MTKDKSWEEIGEELHQAKEQFKSAVRETPPIKWLLSLTPEWLLIIEIISGTIIIICAYLSGASDFGWFPF
jgi:hypothetical protein